ncbi:hypothetical protein VTL71DRAFT_13690 [Oculimacula yallundae]|uniref:Uncharacterized protein n=1 Tax=Oculimacula yallundae TaxID=86028 RepID=A0ABR4CLM9_9HELO
MPPKRPGTSPPPKVQTTKRKVVGKSADGNNVNSSSMNDQTGSPEDTAPDNGNTWDDHDQICLEYTDGDEITCAKRAEMFFGCSVYQLLDGVTVQIYPERMLYDEHGDVVVINTCWPHRFCKKLKILLCVAGLWQNKDLLNHALNAARRVRLGLRIKRARNTMPTAVLRHLERYFEQDLSDAESGVERAIGDVYGHNIRDIGLISFIQQAYDENPKPGNDKDEVGVVGHDITVVEKAWDLYASSSKMLSAQFKTTEEYCKIARGILGGPTRVQILDEKKRHIMAKRDFMVKRGS